MIKENLKEHLELINKLFILEEKINELIFKCMKTLEANKIMLCGNGGSAADAQHIASELVGRYKRERGGYAAIALTTDTSILTAQANDYGVEEMFSRQVDGLANEGDLVIGLSTSGNSKNIYRAFEEAKKIGCQTVLLTGSNKGICEDLSDLTIHVPSTNNQRIQEAHMLIGHILCNAADQYCKSRYEK